MLATDFLTSAQLARCRAIFALAAGPRVMAVALAPLRALLAEAAPASVAARYLGLAEGERFLSFSSPQRQAEWLGGRLAAKAAAQCFSPLPFASGEAWRRWQISQNPQGKPYIHGALPEGASDPAISISHGGGLAVAMATASGACGIDLQALTPTLERVRPRFAAAAELAILAQAPGLAPLTLPERLLLLWTAKEACRKAKVRVPLLGFLEMRLRRVGGTRDLGFVVELEEGAAAPPGASNKALQAYVTFHDHFACAITVLI